MPSAVLRLAALGVVLPGRPFRGITYVDARGPERHGGLPARPGQGVRRTDLQATLRSAAHTAGVERVSGSVHGVRQSSTGVGSTSGGRRTRPPTSPRPTGCTRRSGRSSVSTGRRVAIADTACGGTSPSLPGPTTSRCTGPRHAEMYVTPVGADAVGIAILTSHRGRTYNEWLREFPLVAQRLRGAAPASRVLGAGPLRQRASQVIEGRVLLVGDAAGYVDALTGEGLAVGLAGAQALVDALVAGRPGGVRRRVARPHPDLAPADRDPAAGDARTGSSTGTGPVGAGPAVGLPFDGRAARLRFTYVLRTPGSRTACRRASRGIQSARRTVKPSRLRVPHHDGSSSTRTSTPPSAARRSQPGKLAHPRWPAVVAATQVDGARGQGVAARASAAVSVRQRSGRPLR